MIDTKQSKSLQESLENFISDLKKTADAAESENKFEKHLIENITPRLLEDEQIFGVSTYSMLDLTVHLYQLESDQKIWSIGQAMTKMNDKAMCWFLDHIYCCNNVISVLRAVKKGYDYDQDDLKHSLSLLKNDIRELQKWTNNDLYERIQSYKLDIKKIKGGE